MKNSFSLFLVAGESSGDTLGSLFLQALHKICDKAKISGVGGPKMRFSGLDCILETEKLSCMGFTAVISAFPKLFYYFKKVERAILEKNPDLVLLIDFPGFNLRLAKSLKKKGFKGKIVQYVSPSIWAWGPKRKEHLEKYYDRLLCIYPFEPPLFRGSALPVSYVGNPTFDHVQNHIYQEAWKNAARIPENTPLIALFPGSREEEIRRHLPLQLKVAEDIKEQGKNVAFAISLGHENALSYIEDKTFLKPGKDLFFVPKHLSYELMQSADLALAKSGTVCLELALMGCPSVVMYAMSPLNRLITKYLLRLDLPYFSMPNILLKKEALKEFIRKPPERHLLTAHMLDMLDNPEAKKSAERHQMELKNLLNSQNSSGQKVVEEVLQLLTQIESN